MRKITVTEENFEKVLAKIQKRCNKHKMIDFESLYDENMKKDPEFFGSIYYQEYSEKDDKVVKKLYDRFIWVTKHHFREAFETGSEPYYVDMYKEEKIKPLIHISLSAGCASVIYEGDEVRFLPFGIFVVWTHNAIPMKKYTYKDIYVPNYINGKIKDIDELIAKRERDEEELEMEEFESFKDDYDSMYNDDEYDSDCCPDYDE